MTEARKLIESKREGDYITNKIHVLEVEEKFVEQIKKFCEEIDCDESADEKGVEYGYENEIYCINVDKFVKTIEKIIDEEKAEEEEFIEGYLEKRIELLIELKKLGGYEIYL